MIKPRSLPPALAAIALGALVAGFVHGQDAPQTVPGLLTTFQSGGATDVTVMENALLYVPAGQPPTPFLNAGRFTATWEGFVSVDLRDSYTFSAEVRGTLKLEVNGNVVLEVTGDGPATEPSRRVRLTKGENALKLSFTAPDTGDAFVRLHWTSPDFGPEPLPVAGLSHTPGGEAAAKGRALRRGRELFVELRCAQCHRVEGATLPELALDAPAFEGIGSRRGAAWMADWILDPKAQRPTAHMPGLLHGASAQADAAAIAAYLATLKAGEPGEPPQPDLAGAGRELADKLHCVACHSFPGGKETDPAKVSLTHVNAKFPGGALVAFLKAPGRHFAWTRMPDFQLSDAEAAQLAAHLSGTFPAAKNTAPTGDIARGKALVQSTGCLNCHSLELENQFKAPKVDILHARHLMDRDKPAPGDCLGSTPVANFGLSKEDRQALDAFTLAGFDSLKRHVPADFAVRMAKQMHCADCHGKFEGFPPFPVLGGKLKPEWTQAFIAGELEYKPRPWLEARMPVFPKYAEGLAQGMAMLHGLPPRTPAEAPVDPEAAKAGHAMIGTDGGFSCIACHAVRSFGATQVFEAAGLNLVQAAERLQPAYFQRWMLSPLRIDPQTKMPVYFTQGQSPLTDYYNGDALQQVNALWQYLRQGEKMPLPKDAGPP